jgi:hypothetical protein
VVNLAFSVGRAYSRAGSPSVFAHRHGRSVAPIGGYQVCEKWLKDRKGRNLSADDRTHYQKVIVALSENIRLMEEIDVVIAQNGGWPLK